MSAPRKSNSASAALMWFFRNCSPGVRVWECFQSAMLTCRSLAAAMEPLENQSSPLVFQPVVTIFQCRKVTKTTQRGLQFDWYLDCLEHCWEIVIHVWVRANKETVSHLSSISQPSYVNHLSMQDSYLVYKLLCVISCIWMWKGLPSSLKHALRRTMMAD